MTSLAYFPVVETEDQLSDLLTRAGWFLSFCPLDRIYVPVASEALAQAPWRVAPGLDPSIAGKFELLRTKVTFVVAKSEADLDACMKEASLILRWKRDGLPAFVSSAAVAAWQQGKKVLQVDPVAVRMEGSFYIDVGMHLLENKAAVIEENKAKFSRLARKLGKFERAYLMATGPSVAHYKKFDYSGALSIVCNSVIADEELMNTVRPQILVFADPIFHFGPSQYAASFRSTLLKSARKHDYTICIPFKYYALFVAAMPELADRTVGIPFIKERKFNFELSRDFTLKTTANVLTFIMVPLAGTFADEIGFLGCDGRPLQDNTYFWKHNPNTQFNDKMANIREVHPGFFNIDYNDYYLEHCEVLEQQLQAGERNGKRFFSLGFSHIPALKSRLGRGTRSNGATGVASPIKVVIVDPDALDRSGHYLAYNDKLAAALEREGCSVEVLCNQNLAPDILAERKNFHPTLARHSWTVGQADNDYHPRMLEQELPPLIERFVAEAHATLVYMYCGSLEHAQAFAQLTQRFPNVFVHVNLFWTALRDVQDPEWVERWKPFVNWLDIANPRLIATVPTQEIQESIAEAFGVVLEVAPNPSASVGDEQPPLVRAAKTGTPELTVLFPGSARAEKGYEAAVSCARLLATGGRFRPVIRRPGDDTALPDGVAGIDASLSGEAFAELFRTSDIAVLPYSATAFGKRTSGLMIDALHYGVPVIAVEGTWLARIVRKYGCGVVVAEATPEQLAAGVAAVANDHSAFLQKASEGAGQYFSTNTWKGLARSLLAAARAERPYPRLLGIDLTNVGGLSATGRVKETFFRNWPESAFMLASIDGPRKRMRLGTITGKITAGDETDALMRKVREFDPEVVYYRAVDSEIVHGFATHAVRELGKPVVAHLMDDWPERLRASEPEKFAAFGPSLQEILQGAKARLSIGEAMSRAFRNRYRVPFQSFANAVDPAAFPPRLRQRKEHGGFVIRYTGALAEDMTFASVKDVADAIEALPRRRYAQLHIYTRSPWSEMAKAAFASHARVKVFDQVEADAYYGLLQEADALLIAYNFDDRSRTYIGYSMANKMPEYLASGSPLIAYGPRGVATIDYLRGSNAALVVDRQDVGKLAEEIDALIASQERQDELGAAARALAFDRHNSWTVAERFRRLMSSVANGSYREPLISERDSTLVGPMHRGMRAHLDETRCLAEIFSETLSGSTMIDVGAHHGSSLLPFVKLGWRVFAFEPDAKNREKLTASLSRHDRDGRVKLDVRAVSNKSGSSIPFYASDVSTGISGLSAFHDSHRESQKVDTVTLREALAQDHLAAVDFLKIDTEGHDLFVLQGFPWERFTPAVIECEFEDAKSIPLGYSFRDIAQYLVDKGYSVYVSEWHPIVRYGMKHDWNRLIRFPCELNDAESWGNLLAFRDGVDEAKLVTALQRVLSLGGPTTHVAASAPTETTPTKSPVSVPQQAVMASTATPPLQSRPSGARMPSVSTTVPAPVLATPTPAARGIFLDSAAIAGKGWHALEQHEWGAIRWTGPDARATVRLPISRGSEMLAVVAYHMAITPDQLDGLRIEVDRVEVRHSIYGGNPKCLVVQVPARPEDPSTPTELTLVLPRTLAPASVPGCGPDQRLLGLAVLWIAAMPAYPQLPARFPPTRMTRLLRRVGLLGHPPVGEFPLTHFDGLAYAQAYPEVPPAIMAGKISSALEHYRRIGVYEGKRFTLAVARGPNEGRLVDIFDGITYLEAYPDVADAVRSEAVASALDHFLAFGRVDRRPVRIRLDGTARRGSPVDLVRLDAARLTRTDVSLARLELGNEIAARITQLGNETATRTTQLGSEITAKATQLSKVLAEIQSVVPGLATQSSVESARAELRKTLAALDMLRAELDRFDQISREDMDRTHAQVAAVAREREAKERELLSQLAALRADAKEMGKQLASDIASRADHLGSRLEAARAESRKTIEALDGQISAVARTGEAKAHDVLSQLSSLRAEAIETDKQLTIGRDEIARLRDETAQQVGAVSGGLDQISASVASVLAGHEAFERETAEQLGEVRSSIVEKAQDLETLKQGALRDLERLKGEFATALSQREAREQAMLQQIDLLRVSLQEAQGRLANSARADDLERLRRDATGDMESLRREAANDLDRLRRDATGDVDRLRRELISNGGIWRAREAAVVSQIDALKAEVAAAKSRAELAEVKVASAQRELGAETWQIASSLQGLANRLDSAGAEVTKLQQDVGAVKGQTARITHPSLSTLNALGYQSHPRMLQKADAERLSKHWAPLLGLKVDEKELYYLAHRVCSIENACTGRLAASVNDMLLRILVARSVKSESLKILEIGTLFGLGVGAMHEALAPLYERVQFTVIDPLEGYYGAANKDILTGVPVNRSVFEENMRRSGVGANDVKLIQRLSTDPQALKQASRKQYDLLIIDADHTYQGVKNDTERFVATARQGAFVIFDDYNNQHWPDVKKYVDAEVLPRRDLRFVGAEWHTAVCQVTGAGA